jgi:hypothetical protein
MRNILLLMLLLAASAMPVRAQFGFGAGVTVVGDNVLQAGGDVAVLLRQDSIQYGDVAGKFGFYLTGRMKYPLGAVRIIGDASYIFFPAKEITLSGFEVNQDSTASATFDVGTSFIPINAGLEFVLPLPVVRPYIGAEFSYMFVSRTYTLIKADPGTEQPAGDVANKSAGENEAGLAIGAGAEFAVGPVALDLGARLNLANLFTRGTDGEQSMSFVQLGAVLYFGDLVGSGDKDKDDDDDDDK